MRRRRFFGALLAGAAAFVAAPAVRAEAASINEYAKTLPAPEWWDAHEGAWSVPMIAFGEGGREVMRVNRDGVATFSDGLTPRDLQEVAALIAWNAIETDARNTAYWRDQVAEARAEGYERGRAIEQARAESRAGSEWLKIIGGETDPNAVSPIESWLKA